MSKFQTIYVITMFFVCLAITEKHLSGKDDGLFWIFIIDAVYFLIRSCQAYIEEQVEKEIRKKRPPD